MKRLLSTLAALAIITMTAATAQPYKSTVGVTLGMTNAVSYKHFFNEHIAIQSDLGFGIRYAPFKTPLGTFITDCWDFHINPNVVYQANIKGGLDFFGGLGLTIGEANEYYYNRCFAGIFGVNAIAGVEYNFSQPFGIAFDFRPGYGLFFGDEWSISTFDWSLNISFRYRLR